MPCPDNPLPKAFVSPNLPTSSQMPSLGSTKQSLIYCCVWLLLSLRAGRTNCRLIQTFPAAVNLCLVLLLAHLLPLSVCSTGGPGAASKPFVFCFCPWCCCWYQLSKSCSQPNESIYPIRDIIFQQCWIYSRCLHLQIVGTDNLLLWVLLGDQWRHFVLTKLHKKKSWLSTSN